MCLIYGRYECTNPSDFFWTINPLIPHGPPPDLLAPCGIAAFSELFSWESPRLSAGNAASLRAPSDVQHKACLLPWHILGITGQEGPWVGWHSTNLDNFF